MSHTAASARFDPAYRCRPATPRQPGPRTWPGQTADEFRDAQLSEIAREAGFDTLQPRGSDWLDSQTVTVQQMKAALGAAYAAGLAAARKG